MDVHERKAEIRRDLVDAQQQVVMLLGSLGPDGWSRQTPNEGWSVRDVLGHLSSSEAGFVSVMRKMAAGEGGVPADFDPNRWNAGQLRRRTEQTGEQFGAELTAAHADMLALLDGLGGAELDQRGYMSTGGEGSVEDVMRLCARHKRSHAEEIRAALG